MKRPMQDDWTQLQVEMTSPPKRTRHRPVRSCLPCHQTKRKCDRARPCARCTQLSNQEACIYETAEVLPPDEPPAEPEVASLRKRVIELESVVRSLRNARKFNERADLAVKESDAIGILESCSAVRRQVDYSDTDSEVETLKEEDISRAQEIRQSAPPQPSQLPPEPFQARVEGIGRRNMLVGAAATPMLLARLFELAPFSRDVALDNLILVDDGSEDITAWHGPSDLGIARRLIFEVLPEADEAAELLQDFQAIVELQSKAWFSPSLHTKFSSFFLATPAVRLQALSGTLALICAVLALSYYVSDRRMRDVPQAKLEKIVEALGREPYPLEEHGSRPLSVSACFFAAAAQLLLRSCETAPTLESIQAELMLCIFMTNTGHVARSAQLLPGIVRRAQMHGLHIDPRKAYRNMPFVEQETRRRTWWFLQEQDVLVSMLSGLPPIIASNDCDLPQDRTEQSLQGPCAEVPEPLPEIGVTTQSFHVYRLECTLYAREVLCRVFKLTSWHWASSTRQTSVPGVEVIAQIDAAVKLWHSRVPPALCFELDDVRGTPIGPPRRGCSVKDLDQRSSELMTQSLLLAIYANWVLVLLHRPFLQHSMWSVLVGITAERQVLYSASTLIFARCRLGKMALSFWPDAFTFASALTLVQLANRLLAAGRHRLAELQTACRGIKAAGELFASLGGTKNREKSASLAALDAALQANFVAQEQAACKWSYKEPPTPTTPHATRLPQPLQPAATSTTIRFSAVRND